LDPKFSVIHVISTLQVCVPSILLLMTVIN